jgi:branched-chain amino acid aminotransferase
VSTRLETPPYLFMNGEVIPWEQGRVHIWSETAIRATNVFEGLRGYWSPQARSWTLVAWDAHMSRLDHSARLMRIPHAFDAAYFREAVTVLLNALPYRQDVYVRPTIYVEFGPFGHRRDDVDTGAYVVVFPVNESQADVQVLRCLVSSWRRLDDLNGSPRAKSGALYHNVRLPRIEAASHGFDDAILLNCDGKVAELTGACIFLLRGGTLISPPVTAGILEGITRSWLLDEARRRGFSIEERPVDRTELYVADEVLSAGTLSEICAIGQVDDLAVGDGSPGPATVALARAYRDRVRAANVSPDDLAIELAGTQPDGRSR